VSYFSLHIGVIAVQTELTSTSSETRVLCFASLGHLPVWTTVFIAYTHSYEFLWVT